MRHLLCLIGGLTLALMVSSCKQQQQAAPVTAAPPPVAPPAAVDDKPIQIPGIPAPAPGSNDWVKQAHQVSVMTSVNDKADAKADLAVAWTPTALLLKVHSTDGTPVESAPDPWNNDSVEIFLASSFGSDDHVQFVFTPDRSAKIPKPAFHVYDKRPNPPKVADPELRTEKTGDGYTMTISIPWANLKHVPLPNDVIGLQVYVNDAKEGGEVTHRIWFPEYGASNHPELMNRVQLTGQADPPELAAAWFDGKGFAKKIHVSAPAEDVGKRVLVTSHGNEVISADLQSGGPDSSIAVMPLPEEWARQKDAPLSIAVDGHLLAIGLKIPDLAKQQLDLIKDLPLAADPSIFDTKGFPKIDFLNHELVEEAIGPYSLDVRYFDANWNEVIAPNDPGRYGAVVKFYGEHDLTFSRYVTLFKTSQPYNPAKDPYTVQIKFPAAFGLSPESVTKEQWATSDYTYRTLRDLIHLHLDADWAVLVAGLHDLAADPARWHGFTARDIDDVWWTELRKRLGENQDYPHLTYLPDGYDKDTAKTWPLIVFLHGSGERGEDLKMLQNQGPQGYINTGHPLPFIVVTPQCPLEERWDPSRVARLIDQVAAANRVDPKRVYITGLSMGGYGTFELAATYPDKIAAIAPLSGGASPDLADRLKKMPAWIFHGDADPVVPTQYSVDASHAMQKAGAPVKLTIYPGIGHGGWSTTYADPALYAWFLEQHSK